ncbi:MAG: hypothetical protein WCK47_14765, partial [bacterium]
VTNDPASYVTLAQHLGGIAGGSFHTVDCDIFNSGSQWMIGPYIADAGGYVTATPVTTTLAAGQTVEYIINLSTDKISLTLKDAPGGAVIAQVTNFDLSPYLANFAPFGLPQLKAGGLLAPKIKYFEVRDALSNIIFQDDFEDGTVFPKWYGEPLYDGADKGMNIFNFAWQKIGGSRPDFIEAPGFMTIRATADYTYSRVTTRVAPGAAPLPMSAPYGNVDARIYVRLPDLSQANGYVELGLRNNSNEGNRPKVLFFPAASPPKIEIHNDNLFIAGALASLNLPSLTITPGTEVVVTLKSNGTAFDAYVSLPASPNTPIDGTASTTIGSAATAGQVVMSCGVSGVYGGDTSFKAQVDTLQLVDHGDPFPGPSAVSEWQLFE